MFEILARPVTSRPGWRRPWLRFVFHLGEMTVAMLLGMEILGIPTGAVLTALGYSDPILSAVVMTLNMTVPMVLWMRFRGHAWERAGEMGVAMVVPAAVIVMLGIAGMVARDDLSNAVMVPMLPAMAAAMLVRRAEYAHAGAH